MDRGRGDHLTLLSLRLDAWGREGALERAGEGDLHHADERVEVRRHGIVEWFVNGPRGLEHGFTVEKRPTGGGALVFELATEAARARLSGDAVLLDTTAGRKLRYGKLAAWDAKGRELDARFEAPAPNRVQLVIADAGAVYPLTIDPLLIAPDAQLEANQSDTVFGEDVSSAGDVNGDGYADVIVGASGYDAGQLDEGAAFIFLGSATGIADGDPSSAHAQLESDQIAAVFGRGVASAGDVNGDGYADVIVGASYYDAGQTNEGAAFVFLGSASGIGDRTAANAHARLESDQPESLFGRRVSPAGDVNGDGYADVIVGASHYDAGATDEGVALVFLGSASGIGNVHAADAHAQLESDQQGALFGGDVASAGDVNGDGHADLIVGAAHYDNGQTEGAAFVFRGSASGIGDRNPSNADAQLESNQETGLLGYSVASAGDVNGDGYADVIVGTAGSPAGVAFVFLGSASGIGDGNPATAHAKLEGDQNFALLGQCVAAAGEVNGDDYGDVILGAYGYDGGQTDEGAAFVFLGSASGLGDQVHRTPTRGSRRTTRARTSARACRQQAM